MVQIGSFYPGIVFSSLFLIIGRLGSWRCIIYFYHIVFLKSSRPSLALKKFFLPLRLSCKESSTFSPSPSSSGSGDVAALRCSGPLRSKVGGPSKVCARFCGMGPPGVGCLQLPILIQINIDIEWSIIVLYHFHQQYNSFHKCHLLINFAANSKKSATFLKLSNCWQYILA